MIAAQLTATTASATDAGAAALNLLKQSSAAAAGWLARNATPAADAGERNYRPATDFAQLPVYQAIRKQRDMASALGLANPFFRSHDARLGATTRMGENTLINFASYDYLGLNQDPRVGEAAKAAIDQYGTSVSASRVVAGERPLHRALERAIADLYQTEDAIACVSGHATNVSTIGGLMGPDDLIINDELMHNSALMGAKLSRATTVSFRHNDLKALEKILRESRHLHKNALIVVEGLYSMDGDFPDLPALIALKAKYGCWLMVDEAHSLGVMGATGRGVAEHFGIDPTEVEIWMGTLSKTLGACGGYIAGSHALVELLKYQSPGFVYSVGLSPPLTASSLAAIQVMLSEPERVARLQANGKLFIEEAKAAGLDTATSEGYSVVPVMIGCSVKAVQLTERLLARGINALPIIAPAVPVKGARVRFFITSEHTAEQIKTAVRIVREELDAINGQRTPVTKMVAAMMVR